MEHSNMKKEDNSVFQIGDLVSVSFDYSMDGQTDRFGVVTEKTSYGNYLVFLFDTQEVFFALENELRKEKKEEIT
jgi:hypothetical protein